MPTAKTKAKKKDKRPLSPLTIKRRAVPPEIRKALRIVKNLSADQVAEIGSLLITCDHETIKSIVEEKPEDLSIIQLWIANVAVKGFERGDPYALNALLDRIVGKTKDHLVVHGSGTDPLRIAFEKMTAEEQITEIERLRRNREIAGND